MYLFSVLFAFLLGGSSPCSSASSCSSPAIHHDADTYNRVFTLHGAIMIFLFIIPSIRRARELCPAAHARAKDVAFRASTSRVTTSTSPELCLPSRHGDRRRRYRLTSTRRTRLHNGSVGLMTFAVFVLAFLRSSPHQFHRTIHKLRAPAWAGFRMPLFAWAFTPPPYSGPGDAGDRHHAAADHHGARFQRGIFNPQLGGDPILFQHFFWFYSIRPCTS